MAGSRATFWTGLASAAFPATLLVLVLLDVRFKDPLFGLLLLGYAGTAFVSPVLSAVALVLAAKRKPQRWLAAGIALAILGLCAFAAAWVLFQLSPGAFGGW